MPVYLSGSAQPPDQFGQFVLRLDAASRDKLERLERSYKGRSPRFHGEAVFKFTARVKPQDGARVVGQLVTVCARARRYHFAGRDGPVQGWRLELEALGAYNGRQKDGLLPHYCAAPLGEFTGPDETTSD